VSTPSAAADFYLCLRSAGLGLCGTERSLPKRRRSVLPQCAPRFAEWARVSTAPVLLDWVLPQIAPVPGFFSLAPSDGFLILLRTSPVGSDCSCCSKSSIFYQESAAGPCLGYRCELLQPDSRSSCRAKVVRSGFHISGSICIADFRGLQCPSHG
jgi:hypothetical protein